MFSVLKLQEAKSRSVTADDSFDLRRFVDAQMPVFDSVRAQLRGGRKASHWMWFVFPQIRGLGMSETSRRYAIASRDEALSYLDHPILGPRLVECARLVANVEGRTAHEIFGSPDDMKLQSSMTLFASVATDPKPFREVLEKYFGGQSDRATLDRL
jgi:uncharacterized protein (DUF1810 family)